MRLRPPLRMSVTRRGEKEQRLGEFVGDYLAGRPDVQVMQEV